LEQRLLEGGEVSHRPVPEPINIGGRVHDIIEPPGWLLKEAKDYWRQTIVQLIDVGMIDLVDVTALEMLASTYARWRRAVRDVNRRGLIVQGRQGLVLNPAARVERDMASQHLKFAEQFGLTPLARARLGLAEVHRRSLEKEMDHALDGTAEDDAADAEVVNDDDDDAGLPT
jgi:P27 family predicted phage terminase small subunit